jgi:hypothetical protein
MGREFAGMYELYSPGNGNKKIRAGTPAAPKDTYLVLLPFGPDTVRRTSPRRTHPDRQ